MFFFPAYSFFHFNLMGFQDVCKIRYRINSRRKVDKNWSKINKQKYFQVCKQYRINQLALAWGTCMLKDLIATVLFYNKIMTFYRLVVFIPSAQTVFIFTIVLTAFC